MKRLWTRSLAVVTAFLGAACAESSMPGQPSPSSGGPGPSGGSGSLIVAITSSQLGCHPKPSTPCTVNVEAVVANAQGRPLTYNWSGCATGTARTATCTVVQPGDVVVSVRATDDRGEFGDATAMATGTNQPPVVTITDSVMFESWNASSGGGSFEVAARVTDPETSTTSDCGVAAQNDRRSVAASGICTAGYSRCLVGTLDVGAIKTAASGTCTLAFTARDDWGLSTTVTKSFTLPHK